MRSFIVGAVVAIAMGPNLIQTASGMYGVYAPYGSYGSPEPTYEVVPIEPEPVAEPPIDIIPIEPPIVPTPEPVDICIPVPCEPGDKSFCGENPMAPPLQEGVFDCCIDEYCTVCHQNGCNQCCDGSFKFDYDEACIPCCVYDDKAVFCQDFYGSAVCVEGYISKEIETGKYKCTPA